MRTDIQRHYFEYDGVTPIATSEAHRADPYAPQYLPENEHLDSFPEEEIIPIDTRVIGKWAVQYHKRVEEQRRGNELSSEDETRLADIIAFGKFAEGRLQDTDETLDTKSRLDLQSQVQEGLEARNTLVTSNLSLAAWFTRKTMDLDRRRRIENEEAGIPGKFSRHLHDLAGGELDYDDRMQIATEGLIKAAQGYNGTGKFSTYAMVCMESALVRAFRDLQSPLKIPDNVISEMRTVQKAKNTLEMTGTFNPTEREIGYHMDRPAEEVGYYSDIETASQRISYEVVDHIVSDRLASNDDTPEDDGPNTMSEILPDGSVDLTPEEEVVYKLMLQYARDYLNTLEDERSLEMLQNRFGFIDGKIATLDQIGARFGGLTASRVHQIELQAFTKLRRQAKTYDADRYLDLPIDPTRSLGTTIRLTDAEEAYLGTTKLDPTHSKPGRKYYSKPDVLRFEFAQDEGRNKYA